MTESRRMPWVAAGPAGRLHGNGREAIVFTHRALLSVCGQLRRFVVTSEAFAEQAREAVSRVYLSRLGDASDRAVVASVLEMQGLVAADAPDAEVRR